MALGRGLGNGRPTPPHAAPRIRGDPALPSKEMQGPALAPGGCRVGMGGSRHCARPRALQPRCSHLRAPHPRRPPPEAAHSDARGGTCGGIGGCAERPLLGGGGGVADKAPGRMLRCGARRPPQATRARIPQKFGSGSVGSEMQPKPRFSRNPAQINTHKHAHRRRLGPHSQPRVPATGKSPGGKLAMRHRLRLAAPGAAARPRRSQVATEVPGVTGPARRRNGRSRPAASAARGRRGAAAAGHR